MDITLPDATALDEARAIANRATSEVTRLRKQYDKALTEALTDVTADDLKTYDDVRQMSELAFGNTRAHRIVEEWVKSLGAPTTMRLDGMLTDERTKPWRITGPSVTLTVPYKDDVAVRDLETALRRYMDVIRGYGMDVGVKIMDNGLSESGVPYLVFREDGSFDLMVTTFGSDRTEGTWPTLREALAWISENRWYGEPYGQRESAW